MAILKLEDLASIQLAKDVKEELKECEVEIKRLGFSVKLRGLNDYDMFDAQQKGSKAFSLDEGTEANAFTVEKGCIEPNFKDVNVRKALGSSTAVGAITKLLTRIEIGEIAIKIKELSTKESTISVKKRVEGLHQE